MTIKLHICHNSDIRCQILSIALHGLFIKPDCKLRTAVYAVGCFNGAVLPGNNRLCKGKPDTEAVVRRIFTLVKAVKNVRKIVFVNTASVVVYRDFGKYGRTFGFDVNNTACRCMFMAVFDNVGNGFDRPIEITAKLFVLDFDYQFLPFQFKRDFERFNRFVNQLPDACRIFFKSYGSCVDFRYF